MAASARPLRPAILGAGPFGRHVADLLHALLPAGVRLSGTAVADAFGFGADAVVIALWRPSPAICDQADRLAHATGTPWLPVTAEHPYVVAGPWIVPGAGPCFACYRDRRIQHDAAWPITRAIHRAYDDDPECGPAGFLPQHARMAAGVAAGYLAQAPATGTVTRFALLRPVPTTDRVIACHGCERCGTTIGPRDLRRLLRLDVKEYASDG
ncbi:MAG: hypothetical protein HOY76_23400 [Streptomyces sp.]|nr:hypothetical protein [Streptomyces sp.]